MNGIERKRYSEKMNELFFKGKQETYFFFGWKQSRLVELGLTWKMILLLDYLIDYEENNLPEIPKRMWRYYNEKLASGADADCFDVAGMPLTEHDGVFRYTWLFTEKILNDLPSLYVKESQLRSLLNDLKDKKLIKTVIVDGRYRYFRTVRENVKKLS